MQLYVLIQLAALISEAAMRMFLIWVVKLIKFYEIKKKNGYILQSNG